MNPAASATFPAAPEPSPETGTLLALVQFLDCERLGSGPLAALRRIAPGTGLPPDFWRVLMSCVPDELRMGAQAERAWALIINGIALMAPEPHRSNAWPGRVLAETGYSEPRLVRLLRAEGEELFHEARIAGLWLAARARPVDWVAFGRFLLSRLHPGFLAEANRARHTHDFARAYFGAMARMTLGA